MSTMETVDGHSLQLDIVDLVQQLAAQVGWTDVPGWFRERGFKARLSFDDAILTIKYEQCCQLWAPLWARQCRGITLLRLINGDGTTRIVCIKSLLMRGSELMLQSSPSEPSTVGRDHKHLDEGQQVSAAWLSTCEEVENDEVKRQHVVLSNKSDGSLLGVTLVPRSSQSNVVEVLEQLIVKHGDELAHRVLAMSRELPFLVIISSQNTLFLHESMHAFAVTAILSSCQRGTWPSSCLGTPAHELEQHGTGFFKQLERFWCSQSENARGNNMSLSFESVCARRTSAWGDEHIELAVSYDTSQLLFLGATLNVGTSSAGTFQPHFAAGMQTHGWLEPRFWTVSDGARAREMVRALDRIVAHKDAMSEKEFLNTFPPDNVEVSTEQQLDLEGFILLRRYDDTDNHWCYSKIKTQAYYKSHHVDVNNLTYLLATLSSDAGSRFPLVEYTRLFFHEIPAYLARLCGAVIQELSSTSSPLVSSLSVKAQTGFDERALDVRVRILLSQSTGWRNMFDRHCGNNAFSRPRRADKLTEFQDTLRALFLLSEPWNTNHADQLETHIQQTIVDKRHPTLLRLYCLAQSTTL